MVLTNKVYDVVKAIAMVWLPAAGVLYFALAGIWALPYAKEVSDSVIAVDLFLGAVLGISTAQYNKNNSVDSSNMPTQ